MKTDNNVSRNSASSRETLGKKPLEIYWKDKSDTRHRFWIYRRGTKFNEPCPGIYIYARETSPHKWIPIYIGQTENVNIRLTNPEQQECVDQNGATHIHVSIVAKEKSRLVIEKDLIQQWKPVCNTQCTNAPQFGLIAEEVAQVNPDLVVRDKNGEIYTVRYDAVNAMLLDEFLKEDHKLEEQEATITQLRKDFQATVAQLSARLQEQDSKIQRVRAQLEMNKPVSQMMLNDK